MVLVSGASNKRVFLNRSFNLIATLFHCGIIIDA